MAVTDLASILDDGAVAHEPSRRLILEAMRLASKAASSDGRSREAWCLLLHSDVLTCIASSEAAGSAGRGPFRVSEHPAFDEALATGEIVNDVGRVVLPIPGERGLLGVLVLDGEGRLDERQREMAVAITSILGLGLTQANAVTELQLEAERSRRLERLKSEFLNIAAHELRSPLGIIRGYASMLGDGVIAGMDGPLALNRITEKT